LRDVAPGARGTCLDDDAVVHPFLHLGHVADDADDAPARAEGVELIEDDGEGVGIE
jgi:hypothetical protein